jgi:hydrogenase/urease accessory protein HupE
MSRFDARPWLVLLTLLLGVALPAHAHPFGPALLELSEIGAEWVEVRWEEPAGRVGELRPVLPAACEGDGPAGSGPGPGIPVQWVIACPGGLVGKRVGVEGIVAGGANVLLRLELQDGRSIHHVLTEDRPSFDIPERQSRLGVLETYAALGIEHILLGFDHLLFVLALVLLVPGPRRLLGTITGFTVGHSLTLALAVLGIVHVPQAPIEAGIALSICALAIEIARSRAGKTTLTQRAPWLVAGLLGLLHGLGFAGALAEIGLPEGEIPLALFAFNVGIEAGQLAFVALVLGILAVLRRLRMRWPAPIMRLPAYAIGSLAAFWFFERIGAALTGAS